jgi:hypothetical protein
MPKLLSGLFSMPTTELPALPLKRPYRPSASSSYHKGTKANAHHFHWAFTLSPGLGLFRPSPEIL